MAQQLDAVVQAEIQHQPAILAAAGCDPIGQVRDVDPHAVEEQRVEVAFEIGNDDMAVIPAGAAEDQLERVGPLAAGQDMVAALPSALSSTS